MITCKKHWICLFLIIGLLIFSGNASADDPGELNNLPPAREPADNGTDSFTEVFSIANLIGQSNSEDHFRVIPDQSEEDSGVTVADADQEVRGSDQTENEDADETEEILYFKPIAEQYSPDNDDPEKTWEEELLDPLQFIANIERLPKNDDDEAYESITIADTDPILISLEGDRELNDESDTNIADEIDQGKMESADSPVTVPVADISIYTNKRINGFIRLYARRKRDIFRQAIKRSGRYLPMIHRIFAEYRLPPNLAYLAVVESNFNPVARSRANAVGLWQFMKYTGRVFNLQNSWWHDDRYDPEKSTVAAAKYLKRLYRRFDGDWELALAAYNSGSGTVRRAIRIAKRKGKNTDFWSLRLPRETRGYVPAFYAVATIFRDLDGYGFKERPVMLKEPSCQLLAVAGGIPLRQIAEALDIDSQVLSQMNMGLRLRGLVPPTYDEYQIRIPGNLELTASQNAKLKKLAEDRLDTWKTHIVRQGETLWSISRYYRIPVKKILAFNRFKRKNLINIGQKLMLPVASNWKPPAVVSRTKQTIKKLENLPGVTYVYKVQKGDTLWKISNQYNIPIRVIKHWNRKVLNRNVLKIGTEIVLKLSIDQLNKSLPGSV